MLVRTDIAGFVGFAERGPLPIQEDFATAPLDPSQVALKITSWKEFQINFGGFPDYGYLAYEVRAFFENGGDTCYVVRVAATTAANPADRPAKAFFALPSGAPVAVGTLDQIPSPFQIVLKAAGNVLPVAGDLMTITGGGVTQLVHVAADLGNGEFLLTAHLDGSIPSGAAVSIFPSACVISAASRGNWGNQIQVQITPLDSSAFAMRVTVDLGPETLPAESEFYRRLTLGDPTATDYAPAVVEQQSNLVRMEVLGAAQINLNGALQLQNGQFYLQGGRDGLSAVTLDDFSGKPDDLRGLRLLEEIEDVAILAIPDAVYQGESVLSVTPPVPDPCLPLPLPRVDPVLSDPTATPTPLTTQECIQLQLTMIDQCQRLRYRVALIDPPDGKQVGEIQNWATSQNLVTTASRYAAIYYPWLCAPDSLMDSTQSFRIPPSGYVAGTYAYTDLNYGVQRPPANLELQFVDDVGETISDLQQGGLNQNNVNAIRNFPGRGIRVWGAKSLAPAGDDNWRFIHVRRLMSSIEETVQRASQWAVFQVNNDALRNSLKHSLTVLLEGIWANGGLKGAKPEEAFYVKCDATNNPQTVVDRGQIICEVGIAPAAPMEFIVFEIRQDAAGAQVLEN